MSAVVALNRKGFFSNEKSTKHICNVLNTEMRGEPHLEGNRQQKGGGGSLVIQTHQFISAAVALNRRGVLLTSNQKSTNVYVIYPILK